MQPRHVRRRPAPGLLLIVGLVPAVLAVGLLLRGSSSPPPSEPSRPAAAVREPAAVSVAAPAAPASGAAARAARVLRAWDEARAAAWEAGSVGALRRLYAEGAGASDVRLLRSYLDRGLRVRGLRVQLLAVEVLAHAPGEWRLRVTDRLAAGTAVGAGDETPLPRDRATTCELRLVRVDGWWRMVEVRSPVGRR